MGMPSVSAHLQSVSVNLLWNVYYEYKTNLGSVQNEEYYFSVGFFLFWISDFPDSSHAVGITGLWSQLPVERAVLQLLLLESRRQ